MNKYGELATLFHQKVHFLSDFKIGELTVPEIEECKTQWILHDQKFIIGKENFTKVKNSLNLFYGDKKYITCQNED